jgi:hypothetical protein
VSKLCPVSASGTWHSDFFMDGMSTTFRFGQRTPPLVEYTFGYLDEKGSCSSAKIPTTEWRHQVYESIGSTPTLPPEPSPLIKKA